MTERVPIEIGTRWVIFEPLFKITAVSEITS